MPMKLKINLSKKMSGLVITEAVVKWQMQRGVAITNGLNSLFDLLSVCSDLK